MIIDTGERRNSEGKDAVKRERSGWWRGAVEIPTRAFEHVVWDTLAE
jgi:hypothetical protein